MNRYYFFSLWLLGALVLPSCSNSKAARQKADLQAVYSIIETVNNHWQQQHSPENRSFWDNAAYHTGNMEAYALLGNEDWRSYSEAWAQHNEWKGAKSDNREEWKYSYGERDDYVLFGDWQICFQTYLDLNRLAPDPQKVARAREVMEYQMSTDRNDYWWWADGLYMVMPVMTKLYQLTQNELYLQKLEEYYRFAEDLMFDEEEGLFFRDAKYVFPKEPTVNGRKNFWARGNGWVFAAYAKILPDLPDGDFRRHIEKRFCQMASALKQCQQEEGYWTRSLLDAEHAPGYETSGTAFFTYGLFWGINQGLLSQKDYLSVAKDAWHYLTTIALQEDGSVGYVQPIGERAIPGQKVSAQSTANFGVGAFLLASCEYARYRQQYR